MKIILLSDIKSLGKKGELKNVAEGYAMNFLLPKKMAEIATPEAVSRLEKEKEDLRKRNAEEEGKLKKIASEINGEKITIEAKSKKGKLFGSITAKNIFAEAKKKNLDISEKNIILEEPIKTAGEREITIDFGKKIKAKIILDILEK